MKAYSPMAQFKFPYINKISIVRSCHWSQSNNSHPGIIKSNEIFWESI